MAMDNLVSQNWTQPLHAPESIPRTSDIVIIGGGIVGVSTAYFLARAGVNVTLCEKGHIACEQSGRNWGWVRKMLRDTREIPMMIESARIWENLANEIGEDVGFVQGGCLVLAQDQKYLNELEAWLPIAEEYGLDTCVVNRKNLNDHIAGAADKWVGGLYTKSDACAEPHKAAPAISRAAAHKGANILTSCAVRGIETAAGKVSAVVTEHGTIKTSTVLCAGGAWTSMFCRSLGISLPQLKVKGTVARLAPSEKLFDGDVYDDRLGIRRRQDGGYTIADGFLLDHPVTPATIRFGIRFLPALMMEFGKLRISIGKEFWDELCAPVRWSLDEISPFEQNRILSPAPSNRALRKTRAAIDNLLPQLASVKIVESWAGMVEVTPDVVPIICETAKIPGFFVATGFSGHGFGIGPGAGKAAAEMVSRSKSTFDLSDFNLRRFFDGTKIRPQQSV